MCASVLVAFTSCHSSQSAYKKAYEKAKQESANKKSESVDGAVAPVAVQNQNSAQETPANVRQEKVTVVSGADALNDYNVVAGSFGLKANAEGLKDYLVREGYSQTVVAFNASNSMYRVIVSSFTDYNSAVQARDAFKAKYPTRKDFKGSWVLFRTK